MKYPRDQGPIPLVTDPRRLAAMARKKRDVCLCDACVAAMPERAAYRERGAKELRAKMAHESVGGAP